MSVTIIERHDSRNYTISAKEGSGAWKFTAYAEGEEDPETAVEAAILAATDFYWKGFARQELQTEPIGGGWYNVTVPYQWELPDSAAQDPTASPDPSTGGPGGGPPSGTPPQPETAQSPLGPDISIDIGGRPPKLTQSLDVVYSEMAGGGLAPNHGRIINYNRVTNEVDGCEVDDPSTVFNISRTVDSVSMDWVNRLDAAVWSKNAGTWCHREPGSVAFMGATFRTGDDGRPRADFRMGFRPRRVIREGQLRDDSAGVSAGPDDDGPSLLPTADTDMRGWDYLEIQYENLTDPETGLLVARPMAMRIHEILPDSDFYELGIFSDPDEEGP